MDKKYQKIQNKCLKNAVKLWMDNFTTTKRCINFYLIIIREGFGLF